MDESQYWCNRDGYEFELKQQRMAFEIDYGCLQIEILKQQLRPSIIWKPTLHSRPQWLSPPPRYPAPFEQEFLSFWKDFAWCVIYGESDENGVVGFGNSPEEAMLDFDKQWVKKIDG